MSARPIITLTTDFGLADGYVAAMKAVILSIAGSLDIVDVTHEIRPQNIGQASFVLGSCYQFFPSGTIHVAVVDPGVGTDRRAVAVTTDAGTFVGPDNGLFAPILAGSGVMNPDNGKLSEGRGFTVENPRYLRPFRSNTFDGRDVFAPAAAHLALGVPASDLGEPIDSLIAESWPAPRREESALVGSIVYIDRFGNAISNLREGSLPPAPRFEIAGQRVAGLASSYQDGPVVAIVGGTGFVEIAVRGASAARELGIRTGDALLVYAAE